MKKTFTLFFLLFFGFVYSQIDAVLFDYDAAGNQIKRYAIDISGRAANNDSIKKIEDLTEKDLLQSDIYEEISYYPNPVKEELFVKWTIAENKFVEQIDLYSMTGQLLTSIRNLKKTNTTNIAFSSYPEGMYNLVILYSDREQKTLKVIKK